jgi:hypothetical protein
LLIGNKGEDTLSFVDLASGRELARAPTGRMPHEIAISPDGRQAAVVAYGGTSIDVFDVASRTRLRTVELAPNQGPHGLIWLDDGRLVATTERSRTLTLVDTRNADRVTAVPTEQDGTHMVAVSPDRRRAYTANIPAGTVTIIDLVNNRKLRDLRVGGEQAVRPEPRVGVGAVERLDADVVDVEETVLQLDVDIVSDRLADARNHLPREARVAVVEERRLVRKDARVVELDASHADAAANEAADAFIIAEVEHAVQHEAQRIGIAAGLAYTGEAGRALARQTDRILDLVQVSLLVGHLRLEAERAKIVADEDVAIEAIFVIDLNRVLDCTDVDVDILDDHRAKIATDIPGAVTRQCRGGEHGG